VAISKANVDLMIDMWENRRIVYDEELKASAHQLAKRWLRQFAKTTLGCESHDFVVRSNKAGIAVSGEVTLHVNRVPAHLEGIYIQINQSPCGTVLYRTCKNAADYVGGINNWSSLREFVDNPGKVWKILTIDNGH